MDYQNINMPIAVAKPVRGREMQSTAITKDVLDTMKTSPREGNVEMYHEGYIDGKLYLVPDTNLEAMRDLVNINMRPRHSSAVKPKTSLEEPSRYSEFTSKLDTLLEKINNLACSSDEDSSRRSSKDSNIEKLKTKDKIRPISPKKTTSTDSSTFSNEASLASGKRGKSIDTETKKSNIIYGKPAEDRIAVPPMLDENIKYKSVKTKDFSKSGCNTSRPTTDSEVFNRPEVGKEKLRSDYFDAIRPSLSKEQTFRLLVSGHVKHGLTPIFIIHQNYTGPNLLEDHIPDFSSHKVEGNIDIGISGKFFTENILVEKSFDCPAVLKIEPHTILIDKQSIIHKGKFKNIYTVGPVDISLEGEFLRDGVTLKYTPVLSLEIMKQTPSEDEHGQDSVYDKMPTTVLYMKQPHVKPIKEDESVEDLYKTKSHDTHRHVHYGQADTESTAIEILEPKPTGFLKIITRNKLYKKIFYKNKDGLIKDSKSDNDLTSSNGHDACHLSKKRRAMNRSLKRRQIKEQLSRRLRPHSSIDGSIHSPADTQVYHTSHQSESPFISKPIYDHSPIALEYSGKTNKHHVKKKKKKDKNQAIIENPILAQMQEFFIA